MSDSTRNHASSTSLADLFRSSYREFRSTKMLVTMGLFMALCIVLSHFTIRTPIFYISFTSLANMYLALLVGPIAGAIFGVASDLLKFAINSGGTTFFPGYTFTEALGFFIYGMFFYKQKITFKRVLCAKFVAILICNVLFGTLWLAILSGVNIADYFRLYMPVRLTKNLIQWPVDSIIFCSLAGIFARAGITRMMASPTLGISKPTT